MSITNSFNFGGILKSLNNGEDYKSSPPVGPREDLPELTDEQLLALQRTVHGEEILGNMYSYQELTLIEPPNPIDIDFPQIDELKDINICGIDGSNQRIECSAFYFILCRAAIVDFRYSTSDLKPYFYSRKRDSSAVVLVDGNAFKDTVYLKGKKLDERSNLFQETFKRNTPPMLVRYSPDKVDKSPSSHALGWAVKLQQLLELQCLKDVPLDVETVCIKDGPLFSTSVSAADTLDGLNVTKQWKNQTLIAVSKRVRDSRMLVEALANTALRDVWFPDQEITDSTLKAISTDSILLPRILKPGQRTPFFRAIPRARTEVPKQDPMFTPLSCYYLSKHRPHTYLRLEVPQFMWEKRPGDVEKAIRMVAWQHDLGQKAPLVQLTSDLHSQLQYEKTIVEHQVNAQLYLNNLDFPHEY